MAVDIVYTSVNPPPLHTTHQIRKINIQDRPTPPPLPQIEV